MLRATQNSEIPAADLARVRAEDSERTKMLKNVLTSVAKHASSGLGGVKDEEEKKAKQLIMQKAQEDEDYIARAVMEREFDPCGWGYLSAEQEKTIRSTVTDDDIMREFAVGTEFSDVLKKSGAHVSNLSDSLSSNQTLPERPPHIDSSPAEGICLVNRHEAEVGDATAHKRIESAAWSFVQDNVKFKELDKLDKQIEEPTQVEGFRKHFDSFHKYHHVLVDLTDHALVDRGIWRGAVQEAMFPTEVRIAEAAPKVQTNLFAPKALNRSTRAISNRQSPGAGAKASRISWAAAGGQGSSRGSSPLSHSGSMAIRG